MDVRFNAYKAKFDTLDSLTKDIFNSQQIDKVNIFISLDDVYWHCRNSNVNREFQCCGNLASIFAAFNAAMFSAVAGTSI